MTRNRARARISAVRPLRGLAAASVLAAFSILAPVAFAQGYGGTVGDILVRGDSLLAQKRPNEAIVQFQEARTLCPTAAEMVHSLQGEAQGRIGLGELLPAAGLLEEAVSRFPDDPRDPDMLYQAGALRFKGKETGKAIDLLRRALDKKPTPDDVPTIKYTLAQYLRSEGRVGEVIELLKDFETAHPGFPLLPNVLYTLAISNHDLGNLEAAETIYRRLLKRYAGHEVPQAYVEAHFELAAVLAARGKQQEAVDYYRKYVTLEPTSPYAGAALERAGDALLFRSPRMSAELYALARVKAASNPKPALPEMGLSRWIGSKSALAEGLSRVWVLLLAGLIVIGALVLLGRSILHGRSILRAQ